MTMQEQSKPTIGFIGMGHMGSHMAPRLIRAGYHLTVYDRTREKAQAIAGATVADTPEEAASNSDVVIPIVSNDAALEEVMLGPNGVLAGTHAGSVIIDMSTVSPHTSRHLFQRSEEHTSELQSLAYLVCRLLLEKKKNINKTSDDTTEN